MKNLILLLLLILFTACRHNDVKKPIEEVQAKDTLVYQAKSDSTQILVLKNQVDSIIYTSKNQQKFTDSLVRSNDSLRAVNNKLAKNLMHQKLIIENARYYLNITIKNPKQDPNLKGWMRRALNQETQ